MLILEMEHKATGRCAGEGKRRAPAIGRGQKARVRNWRLRLEHVLRGRMREAVGSYARSAIRNTRSVVGSAATQREYTHTGQLRAT